MKVVFPFSCYRYVYKALLHIWKFISQNVSIEIRQREPRISTLNRTRIVTCFWTQKKFKGKYTQLSPTQHKKFIALYATRCHFLSFNYEYFHFSNSQWGQRALEQHWHHKYFKYELFWCVSGTRVDGALSIHSTFIKCIVNEAATEHVCLYVLSCTDYRIIELKCKILFRTNTF